MSRLLNRRDTWLVAAGMGCLTLAAVLLLREWGLWFERQDHLARW